MDVFASIAGGATGALVKALGEKGMTTLIERLYSANPVLRQRVEDNLVRYVKRLAQRVERLEADVETNNKERIEESLADPAANLFLEKAARSAGSTDREDCHSLLVELVAQRMVSGPEDMIALVGNAACDVVCSLSQKHFRILALLAVLWKLRPVSTEMAKLPIEAVEPFYISWWDHHLGRMINLDDKITILDVEHLAAMSCCTKTIGSYQIAEAMKLIASNERVISHLGSINKSEWWLWLDANWKGTLEHLWPTSIGHHIGTLYHDLIVGGKTKINW